MLQAGYVFCHRCGHATQDAYYFNSEAVTWLQLFRTPRGKFNVAKYIPPYLEGQVGNDNATSSVSYRFSSTNDRRVQGIQHEINVECYVGNRMQLKKFVRACPFCIGQKPEWDSVQELLPKLGNLPTYVVAVVGARTVGKSCWIHALSCPSNINVVNKGNKSGYLLSTEEWTTEVSSIIEPTELNKLGKTRMMYIKKKSGADSFEVAQILVMDFAGELFAESKKAEFESGAAHIFKGGEGFSGVDAVVLMTDPLPEADGFSLATTYDRAKGEYDLLQNKPVVFVMNKSDLLVKNPPTININNNEKMPKVPLLTEDTFANQGADMYKKEKIQKRVALQTAILKHQSSLVQSICYERRSCGFLIKSTEPCIVDDPKTGTKKEKLDFKKTMNVMDPLLWILNELDIFPIDD